MQVGSLRSNNDSVCDLPRLKSSKVQIQKTVTISSTEAELLALSTAAKETIWWTRFFDTVDFDPGQETFIQCDNTHTIRAFTSDTPRFTTELCHVDFHRHCLK